MQGAVGGRRHTGAGRGGIQVQGAVHTEDCIRGRSHTAVGEGVIP